MKTYQFTNRHGRQVQVGQEQAVFLYGNPSMKFDGELITKRKQVKNPNGTFKKKNGEFVYETICEINPESKPFSEDNDYTKSDKNVIELRSVIGKSGKESPRSHLNKKSIR